MNLAVRPRFPMQHARGTPRRLARAVAFICMLLVLFTGRAGGQSVQMQVEVPAQLQYTLLTRILSFDRSMNSIPGKELSIALVHQPGFPDSRDFAREFEAAWRATEIREVQGKPIRFIRIELQDMAGLQRDLALRNADIVIIAPLRALPVGAVIEAARKAGARTVAAVPGYVDEGAAVGFAVQGGKPRIRINLKSARTEGSDFEAQLLQLAEVLR
jgi:hypothetical protein